MGRIYVWIFLSFLSLVCCVKQNNVQILFQNFMQKHNKQYKIGSEEYYLRMKIFAVSWAIIKAHTITLLEPLPNEL